MDEQEVPDEDFLENYDDNNYPLAYLLTFRTFGTWLHGDERGSVGRNGQNIYRTSRIKANRALRERMVDEMKQPPVTLDLRMRQTVELAVKELCERRGYGLSAVNARTNHVHSVVSAQMKPERIIDALKANATKHLREQSLFSRNIRVWSRGRSRRYLWRSHHVLAAIDYVLYGQGDAQFELPE